MSKIDPFTGAEIKVTIEQNPKTLGPYTRGFIHGCIYTATTVTIIVILIAILIS